MHGIDDRKKGSVFLVQEISITGKLAIALGISHPFGVRNDSPERWGMHEIPE
jgi:hypothetical protein